MTAVPPPSLDEAERRLQRGDAPGAEALLRALLGAHPDHAEALNLLGNALQAQKRADEAEGCYHRALALRPGFYKPIANLGNLLAQRGLREEAIARYGEALAIEPGALRTRTNLGHELFAVGRFEEAAAAYATALESAPSHPPARLGLGRALLALDRADTLDDPRFADRFLRIENTAALREIIETALATDSPRIWEDRLNAAGAPAASIWRIEDVIEHRQIVARDVLQTVETEHGPMRMVGSGFHLAHGGGRLDRGPPAAGADTDTVLTQAGFSDAEIAGFHGAGVI